MNIMMLLEMAATENGGRTAVEHAGDSLTYNVC